jgi:hypothetical protein
MFDMSRLFFELEKNSIESIIAVKAMVKEVGLSVSAADRCPLTFS